MKVYNTLTRTNDELIPINDKNINLFVCGPTVYDFSHIGHAKTYTQFDVIVKYLRWTGYNVFYLQNITDIDDKIINRANELGKDSQELAKQFEEEYYKDMTALKVTSVTKYARATDFIPEIISQVNRLIEKGAYETSDGIYYDLSKFSDYGKLSNQNIEELNQHRVDPNPEKKNSGDFVLWKKAKPGEPTWESPWGLGRPGWHIEDTAITEKFFGSNYDVHGGGTELIFPHHEAEIAQMELISGKPPLVKYWLHTGWLKVKGEKMSKSLGNFLTIRDALKSYKPEVLRYFFMSVNYRSPLDYSPESLEHARNGLQRVQDFIQKLQEITKQDGETAKDLLNDVKQDFIDAMDDDFEISKALASIFELVKEGNKLLSDLSKKGAEEILDLLKDLNQVLDVFNFETEDLDSNIQKLFDEREKARSEKAFALADKIRDELKSKRIILEDTPEGVRWKKV
ncbi:cysteine--tRNA ligase [Candidatus Woesearchaeota archaeon CG10_big_fil_rev_8_21_14_0_10_30_7]|nr:MAG: cysteine--tRNA ligase [Candidatus Woesearchaeota archaeon CG10_big_fil_rev_8_21_14_0_10_30_7]